MWGPAPRGCAVSTLLLHRVPAYRWLRSLRTLMRGQGVADDMIKGSLSKAGNCKK